jgi:hypothetical protein
MFADVDEGKTGANYLPVTLKQVPLPKNISFTVKFSDKLPITLSGHYWYNAAALAAGRKCPAIVEFNPYRCRDGTMKPTARCIPGSPRMNIFVSVSICRAPATPRD